MLYPDAFLWITDPWDTLDHTRDTTLRLVQASVALGVQAFWCDVRELCWLNGQVTFPVHEVLSVQSAHHADAFLLHAHGRIRPREFGRIVYRPDPPVDLAYLHPLKLIGEDLRNGGSSTEVINPINVLLSCCEKTEGWCNQELAPPSCVSCSQEQLLAFACEHQRVVMKPLHEAQSKGVCLLECVSQSDKDHAESLIQEATKNFSQPILLQRFLPAVSEGETRVWFVDGSPVACAKKRPAPGTFCINMDRGATLEPHNLSGQERATITRVSSQLSAAGIRMAAVDMIDAQVTDHNFTSPGLLVQMETVLNTNLAELVMERLASRE